MPACPERESGIPLPETGGKSRREEIPRFSVIGGIWSGVEVVKMETGKETGKRKYHVVWKKDDRPTHNFFGTIQEVLNQHERVIERYLGTVIPLEADQLLKIEGESQRMATLSSALSTLGSRYLGPLGLTDSEKLKNEVTQIRSAIGRVSNEYKKQAQEKLGSALVSPQRDKQVDHVLEANLAILERNQECLSIVQGTLTRSRRVSQKREEWEGTIERSFKELAENLDKLKELNKNERGLMAWHISGKGHGVFVRLQGIPGPEYWKRIQTSPIQNLAHFGDFLREGNDQRARRILREAILKLERVVTEKQERQKTKVEK